MTTGFEYDNLFEPQIQEMSIPQETTQERVSSSTTGRTSLIQRENWVQPLSSADYDGVTDASDFLTGGAGSLLRQESTNNGPTRSTTATRSVGDTATISTGTFGTPVEVPTRRDLRATNYLRGEERLRSLTSLFGEDALVLGHLVFQIPPLAIRIKKGNITYRWKPLRTKETIAVKSGQGECYIEIDLAFVGLSQIQTYLAELISLWKKIPFCFVENAHIRKMMIPDSYHESMALCLETLVIDAHAGRPDAVFATLLTKWFNYKPYSTNFWFRQDYGPLTSTGTNAQTAQAGEEGSTTFNGATPPTGSTILVDLSMMQDPNIIQAVAADFPPEVGLFESIQATNPGDPLINSTYPVVYPFNSRPFLNRVRQGVDQPVQIDSWSDGLTMNWNKFVRLQVPRSWQYSVTNAPEVSVAAETPRTISQEVQVPALPISEDRDIVLFIGDSIMCGYTNNGNATRTPLAQSGRSDVPFFDFNGTDGHFPAIPGLTYKGLMRIGAGTVSLKRWWDEKKTDSSLKAPGNDQPCSRLAGIVIHCHLNDGVTGPRLDSQEAIMREASGFGAIPILCTIPPTNDDNTLVTGANKKLSQLRLNFGVENSVTYHAAVPNYHNRMVQLVNSIEGAILIDLNQVLVRTSDIGNRAAPLQFEYRGGVPDRPTYYNLHPNSNGYRAGGQYLHSQLPWVRRTATQAISNRWTVCSVEDGDTVFIFGNNPDTNEPETRSIRMKFIDTLETYHLFADTSYSGVVGEGGSIFVDGDNMIFRKSDGDFDATLAAVGQYLHIIGGENPTNIGSFIITERPNGHEIVYENTAGTEDTSFDGTWITGGLNPMPEGQDSYRPANRKFGLMAKNALAQQLPVGQAVEVDLLGTDYYGRHLGVIRKGQTNLNLWMVQQGYAFAAADNDPANSAQYLMAQRTAEGNGDVPSAARGLHAVTSDVLQGQPVNFDPALSLVLSQGMRPSDYREVYNPSPGGGHGGVPSTCTQGPFVPATAPADDEAEEP